MDFVGFDPLSIQIIHAVISDSCVALATFLIDEARNSEILKTYFGNIPLFRWFEALQFEHLFRSQVHKIGHLHLNFETIFRIVVPFRYFFTISFIYRFTLN
jgi:hypothetical protein